MSSRKNSTPRTLSKHSTGSQNIHGVLNGQAMVCGAGHFGDCCGIRLKPQRNMHAPLPRCKQTLRHNTSAFMSDTIPPSPVQAVPKKMADKAEDLKSSHWRLATGRQVERWVPIVDGPAIVMLRAIASIEPAGVSRFEPVLPSYSFRSFP